MRTIRPGTDSWYAWLAYHRGSKAELAMLACERQSRAFHAPADYPPPRADASHLTRQVEPPAPQLPPRGAAGDVSEIAERLERLAEQDAIEAAAREARDKAQGKSEDRRERAMRKVQMGDRPDVAKLDDLGTIEVRDGSDESLGKLVTRVKLVNLRDDPIGQMAKRAQIEPLQLEAARVWQAWHDAAQIGGVRGIDPANMRVDGGGLYPEPVSDLQRAAIKRLVRADMRLGETGATLVRRILGDRMHIKQVAAIMGDTSERGVRYIGRRLAECLDTLVRVTGVAIEGRPAPAPRDQAAELARYRDNPALHRAARAAKAHKGV